MQLVQGTAGLPLTFYRDLWMHEWPEDEEEIVELCLEETIMDNHIVTALGDGPLGFAIWFPLALSVVSSPVNYILQAESYASQGDMGSRKLIRNMARDAQSDFGGEFVEEYHASCPLPTADDTYLATNYVLSNHRGKKIGSAMLDFRVNLLKEEGTSALYTHCSNEVSAHMMASRGFEKILLIGPRYSDGASSILMYKRIND